MHSIATSEQHRRQERNKTLTQGKGFQKTKGFHRFHLASAGVVLLHTGREALWGWASSVACDIFMPN